MAISGLKGAVTESLIRRFEGAARGGNKKSMSNALQGKAEAGLGSALRIGAKTYSTAVKSLNAAASLVNVSEATLTGLGKLTDELIELADSASSAGAGMQKRARLNREYHELEGQFRQIVESASVGDTKYLTVEGLTHLFTRVGLNQEEASSVADIFKRFIVSEKSDALASEDIRGKGPLRIPPQAYRSAAAVNQKLQAEADAPSLDSSREGGREIPESPSAVERVPDASDESHPTQTVRRRTSARGSRTDPDAELKLTDRLEAYTLLSELKARRSQISKNLGNLGRAREVLLQNVEIARAAGLAMPDLESQLKTSDDAASVAELLRQRIRRDAKSALSQAENLEPLAVAALVMSTASEKSG